jgi:hypothetical protein
MALECPRIANDVPRVLGQENILNALWAILVHRFSYTGVLHLSICRVPNHSEKYLKNAFCQKYILVEFSHFLHFWHEKYRRIIMN